MKAYMGKRRVAPLILNVGVDDQATEALFPERTPVYTEQEAGWAPEPVYVFWTKKNPAHAGTRTLDRSFNSLPAIWITLSRLTYTYIAMA
jgi:hypothetical protein